MESVETLINSVSESPEALKYVSIKRLNLFQKINDIVFFGKGGFDFDTVYNMPIWLRNYTYNQMKKHYDEEAEAYKKAESGQTVTKKDKPKVPDYVMKKPTKK